MVNLKQNRASPPSSSSTTVCISRTYRGKDWNWSSAYFKESELCVCCRYPNSLGSEVSRHQQKRQPSHFWQPWIFFCTSLDLERGRMKKGGGREVAIKQTAVSLRTIHRPIWQCSHLLSCCAATCITYITMPGECQCFLLCGRMEHATQRDPGPPILNKLGDSTEAEVMPNVHVNFCDIFFSFLGKSPLLCISGNIRCDQEGLHNMWIHLFHCKGRV